MPLNALNSETKQNKTKQNKTKQNKTKQNKTKQNKTKQNKKKNNSKLSYHTIANPRPNKAPADNETMITDRNKRASMTTIGSPST